MNKARMFSNLGGVPEEFLLLPYGEIEAEDVGRLLVDEESMRSIVSHFNRRGLDMIIDYEHQSLRKADALPAGWIKRLINKGSEGLWAVVEWTEKATNYLMKGEYRYFSPVLFTEDRKVMGIQSVALTNHPRLNSLQPIVGNTYGEKIVGRLGKLLDLSDMASEYEIVGALEQLIGKIRKFENAEFAACKQVMDALELDEEATAEAIISKIEFLKSCAEEACKLSLEAAELRGTLRSMKGHYLIERAIRDGKISSEELDSWGTELAKHDPDQFEKIVLRRMPGTFKPCNLYGSVAGSNHGSDKLKMSINKMVGIDDNIWAKYGPKS